MWKKICKPVIDIEKLCDKLSCILQLLYMIKVYISLINWGDLLWLIKNRKTYIIYHNYNAVISNEDKYHLYECAYDFEVFLKNSKPKMKQSNYR